MLSIGLGVSGTLATGGTEAPPPPPGLFGFTMPAVPPTNFPGTLLAPAQAEADDTNSWAVEEDEPAITVSGGQAICDGTNTRVRGVGPLTPTTVAAGHRVSILALISALSGGKAGIDSSEGATNANAKALTGWRQGCVTTASGAAVRGVVTFNPATSGTVEAIHMTDLTALLAQKWFIVTCIAQSNWVGAAATADPDFDTPVPGCVVIPSLANASYGASLDGAGCGEPMLAVDPIVHHTINAGGGPSGAFLRELRKVVPADYTIVFVATGHAGGGFGGDYAAWRADSLTPDAVDNFWLQTRKVWTDAPAGSVMGGIVFCQGESDTGAGKRAEWSIAAPALIEACRAEPGWGDVPVVISEIGGDPVVDTELAALVALQQGLATGSGEPLEFSRCAYVPRPAGATFETDGIHYDQPTNRQRGIDTARALRDLIYP
ncbi:sialate O-acetylesterase [Pelagovum pacificum]|nr:sialate O-acetylesterase [Pelagovum pacificum]QQA41922.1 hypothetical protein I8N54_14105 [Pelagovum pacificum]